MSSHVKINPSKYKVNTLQFVTDEGLSKLTCSCNSCLDMFGGKPHLEKLILSILKPTLSLWEPILSSGPGKR